MDLRGRFGKATAVVAVVCAAAAAATVLPSSPDSFELPKRLAWAALAAALAAQGFAPSISRKEAATSSAAAALLVGYMLARTAFAGAPFWRVAEPLLAWIQPLCLLLVASLADWRDEDRRCVARAVVAIGVAEALLMVFQRLGLDPLFGGITGGLEYAPARMVGTIGYQNQAAELLGVALFCIPASGIRGKAVRLSVAGILLSAILLASGRGAIVAVPAVAAIGALRPAHLPKSGIVKIAAAAALFFAAVWAVPETRSRAGDLMRPGESAAVQSRILSGRVAASLLRESPLFGHGAGSYAYSYIDRMGAILPEKKDHRLLQSIVWAREAHNDPLQFTAEFGIAGFALVTFLAVLVSKGNPFVLPALFLTICSLFSFSWQTSMAAPLTGLLLGMGRGDGSPTRTIRTTAPRHALTCLSAALAVFSLGLTLALNGPNFNIEEACKVESNGGKAPFLKGRMCFEAAKEAARGENAELAFKLAREAERDYLSPDLLAFVATMHMAGGRAREALAYWGRLERSGILYEEALKQESKAYEALGMRREAAWKESRRFELFGGKFTDKELYRLCVLHLMAGDGVSAEDITRRFRNRCRAKGLGKRWTPEWDNLRGSTLLAIGRPQEAKPYFEEALRRKPELNSARKNLERIQ